MNSLVSIIIPTYNRAHLIGETLDSILAQTYPHWECIVVDDGSIDNTDEVVGAYVQKDARFQYYHRPDTHKPGGNGARNFGFELSKGELINWFDDDDVMLPDALQKRISFFKPKVDVVICKLQHYDFDKNVILNETNIIADNPIEDYLVGIITYYISGPIWKREFLLKQKMLFDEGLSNLDDWDFNLRMLYQIPVIKYIEEPLIYYRVHAESLSKEIDK
ncbi:MAG: glycosyltransferase, partial [Flavobacteriaceae bacterium]|nr:glycosyltransferase [Flavobacteriaceae bacterium]